MLSVGETSTGARTDGGLHRTDAIPDDCELDRASVMEPTSAFAGLAVLHLDVPAGEIEADDLQGPPATLGQDQLVHRTLLC